MKKAKRKRKKRERAQECTHALAIPSGDQTERERKEERRRQPFWPFQRTFILTRIFAFLLALIVLENVVDVFGLVYPRNVYLLFLYCIVALFILFVFA